MKKDYLYYLRVLHGKFHEKKLYYKERFELARALGIPQNKKVYLIGTPTHTNLGDSAIALAQKELLKNVGILSKHIKEITLNEYKDHAKLCRNIISKKSLLTQLGGGNMGDIWFGEEALRRCVIEDFQENPMVIFPQTIHYSETEKGIYERKQSVEFYDSNPKLTLYAREQQSYETMKQLYPNTKVEIAPDIVLSTNKKFWDIPEKERKGVLLCLRSDEERKITDSQQEEIERIVTKTGYTYQKIDMYADTPVTKENRFELVRAKMCQFAEAELVITDRLHGMIFSAITETPCIVLSNYNHKVKGTFDWIKHLPYMRYVDEMDEIENHIGELKTLEKCEYDNKELLKYYEDIKNIINSLVI